MARMSETCGAVTGAFMVIGLKYGKTMPDNDDARETTYGLVNRFVSRFKERNSSIVCRDLLGHDLATEEGRDRVAELNLIVTHCQKFVADAAQILDDILGADSKGAGAEKAGQLFFG